MPVAQRSIPFKLPRGDPSRCGARNYGHLLILPSEPVSGSTTLVQESPFRGIFVDATFHVWVEIRCIRFVKVVRIRDGRKGRQGHETWV